MKYPIEGAFSHKKEGKKHITTILVTYFDEGHNQRCQLTRHVDRLLKPTDTNTSAADDFLKHCGKRRNCS